MRAAPVSNPGAEASSVVAAIWCGWKSGIRPSGQIGVFGPQDQRFSTSGIMARQERGCRTATPNGGSSSEPSRVAPSESRSR